ncbi:hypothetical protein CDA63_10215 [Hymenobacter amundsenii]|uniref:Uncharacterized protein n=1 Tax=Hymenobacter amundsenii TaxID=2006685 RepID=A0A2D0AFN5_9BACT|nr:hypothetical protein [Hymenobacter amundsenii]OWP63220.1 hypothetical protein CDA63_10215 [Hymenobacter amundsenii]
MPDEFQTYQRFPNATVAQPLLHLLHEHGFDYDTRLDQLPIDASFAFNETSRYFLVQLRAADFERAHTLELAAAEAQLADLPADYYLFSFRNEELLDVLGKPDEWNSLDVALAQRLLQDRGAAPGPETLEQLRQQRLQELARPEPRQSRWVVAGYVLAIFGGVLSFFIGWHLYSHYRQLPNGERVPVFQAPDRAHGQRLMVLGILGFLALLAWRFYMSR